MKLAAKIILFFFLISNIVSSQESMYIIKNGNVIAKHDIANIDSIVFYNPKLENENSVTDIDENVYGTVVIGTQIWMKENLKTTHYNNGDKIPKIESDTAWLNTKIGAYCYYNNDSNYYNIYGNLYNGYSVLDERNLCPEGWHIPTDAEWTILIEYLGGSSLAYTHLTEVGNTHWMNSAKSNPDNSTGFTGLPAGGRGGQATFNFLGQAGYFWSSTLSNSIYLKIRYLSGYSADVANNGYQFYLGHSVRCIKD